MIPSHVPEEILAERGKAYMEVVGPPKSIDETDCQSIEVLFDTVEGGIFDGCPALRVYYKFEDDDIDRLANNDGLLEFTFYVSVVPMHSAQVV